MECTFCVFKLIFIFNFLMKNRCYKFWEHLRCFEVMNFFLLDALKSKATILFKKNWRNQNSDVICGHVCYVDLEADHPDQAFWHLTHSRTTK